MSNRPENDAVLPDMGQLLNGSVKQILEHENPDLFLNWFQQYFLEHLPDPDQQMPTAPQEAATIATWLGRAIWNAMPLPGNGFRPRPLAEPGRNDPCPCDSARKYKLCCARNPAPPAFDSQMLWPLVLAQLPKRIRDEAVSKGCIPVDALVEVAHKHLEEHHPAKGVKLLEPLFDGVIRHARPVHEYALDLLCDCYDDLGHRNKKTSLLQRVIDTARRSSLRSGALQRKAAIQMDGGDISGAWEAFHEALRDDPKSWSIGILEVQLLVAENRSSEAKERAIFWKRKLHRAGVSQDEGPMEFLSAVANNPGEAIRNVGLGMSAGAGKGLSEWLGGVSDRPIPDYHTSTKSPKMPGSLDEAMILNLKNMGIPQQEIERNLARLQGELDLDLPDDSERNEKEEEPQDSVDSLFLLSPPAIEQLEERWHDVFPCGKPFSVHDVPFGDNDPWDERDEEKWVAFLKNNPEAFDSLDIIDDLATALMQHDETCTQWLDESLLKPLLRRAATIVTEALNGIDSPRIVWGFAENRPALRSLVRLIYLKFRAGEDAEAMEWAKKLLEFNPNDNHGFRSIIVNQVLREGDSYGALNIAEDYPDDTQPDIAYGRVIALFRLSRQDEALEALLAAMEFTPKVPRYLTAKRIRKPKLDPMGVRLGGDDQAWLYREEMRDVWLETPGAIDWLKSATRNSVER